MKAYSHQNFENLKTKGLRKGRLLFGVGQEVTDPLHIVFTAGTDSAEEIEQVIKEIEKVNKGKEVGKRLNYAVFGDGETELLPEDFEAVRGLTLAKGAFYNFFTAHGGNFGNKHTAGFLADNHDKHSALVAVDAAIGKTNSEKFFKLLAENLIQGAANYNEIKGSTIGNFFWACYGGTAANYADAFGNNSVFMASAPYSKATSVPDNLRSMRIMINYISDALQKSDAIPLHPLNVCFDALLKHPQKSNVACVDSKGENIVVEVNPPKRFLELGELKAFRHRMGERFIGKFSNLFPRVSNHMREMLASCEKDDKGTAEYRVLNLGIKVGEGKSNATNRGSVTSEVKNADGRFSVAVGQRLLPSIRRIRNGIAAKADNKGRKQELAQLDLETDGFLQEISHAHYTGLSRLMDECGTDNEIALQLPKMVNPVQIEMKDAQGKSMLDYAKKHKNKALVEALEALKEPGVKKLQEIMAGEGKKHTKRKNIFDEDFRLAPNEKKTEMLKRRPFDNSGDTQGMTKTMILGKLHEEVVLTQKDEQWVVGRVKHTLGLVRKKKTDRTSDTESSESSSPKKTAAPKVHESVTSDNRPIHNTTTSLYHATEAMDILQTENLTKKEKDIAVRYITSYISTEEINSASAVEKLKFHYELAKTVSAMTKDDKKDLVGVGLLGEGIAKHVSPLSNYALVDARHALNAQLSQKQMDILIKMKNGTETVTPEEQRSVARFKDLVGYIEHVKSKPKEGLDRFLLASPVVSNKAEVPAKEKSESLQRKPLSEEQISHLVTPKDVAFMAYYHEAYERELKKAEPDTKTYQGYLDKVNAKIRDNVKRRYNDPAWQAKESSTTDFKKIFTENGTSEEEWNQGIKRATDLAISVVKDLEKDHTVPVNNVSKTQVQRFRTQVQERKKEAQDFGLAMETVAQGLRDRKSPISILANNPETVVRILSFLPRGGLPGFSGRSVREAISKQKECKASGQRINEAVLPMTLRIDRERQERTRIL